MPKLGLSGKIAALFANSKLTPATIILSLLLGSMAVIFTPKEEEPQIVVPMIDVTIAAPGFEAHDLEQNVTEVVERAVWGLSGVEYIYSTTSANQSLVTVRFKVGEPLEDSLVKVHDKMMAIRGQLPANVKAPVVTSNSIDDVPFLAITYSSTIDDDYRLRTLIAPLARELSSTPEIARVELLGGRKRTIRVVADPERMRSRGVNLLDLGAALKSGRSYQPAGKTWGADTMYSIEVGARLKKSDDVKNLPVAQRGGRLVKIGDVAAVIDGPEIRTKVSTLVSRGEEPQRAVTLLFAKRKGADVVELSADILERADHFGETLPADINRSIIRDYGKTADAKFHELLEHLALATLSVSLLIALAMGVRAALVVATAIPVTLALTLATYYFLGYTLNRVTLFALIFSIGILVDDAIVVVENIERHLRGRRPDESLHTVIVRAVSEVGNPTILATFAVIASILPMAFVQGLMGPYMKPIPVGASIAMLFSLLIAFMVTPWAALRILKKESVTDDTPTESSLDRLYRAVMSRLLDSKKYASAFVAFTLALFIGALSLVATREVKVKMLPFDNKSEFQVLIDYPPTTPLAKTHRLSLELARQLAESPAVTRVQVFAGEPAPYSFSGMVKHAFLRHNDYQADLHILLTPKGNRKKPSHQIITELRPLVAAFGKKYSAITKTLEAPPGPPVLATVVAEIYARTDEERLTAAKAVRAVFAAEPSLVDLDYSWREGRPRKIYEYDPQTGARLGAKADRLTAIGSLSFEETIQFYLDETDSPEETPVTLSLSPRKRLAPNPFDGQLLRSLESGLVNSGDLLKKPFLRDNRPLNRKNLRPVEYVLGELTGEEEAPVYGIMKLLPHLTAYETMTSEAPWNADQPIIKWDGEWFITYEVFRDLGLAFAVVMVVIYILTLGWFRSYTLPLIIMAPIPLSLIGILPGHALAGSFFTATSMIGFIAGAGIIVRNSIILVDFIERQIADGHAVREAVISAGILRFRPMILTAAAVIVGSSVMLADPIFQGLALSLIFGEVAATLLSRAMAPMLYYYFMGDERRDEILAGAPHTP